MVWSSAWAEPVDWFCWSRHVRNVEDEQRERQFRALRDAGIYFPGR